MFENLIFVLTLASALGCGLIGGVFFAFSTIVMRALERLPAAQGIAAMQSMNIAVINPVFMTAFLGTGVACLVLAFASFFRWQKPGAGYILAGSLTYLVGAIMVTMLFHVPRNDALAVVHPASAESASLWTKYVATWTAGNHLRTAAALVAAALLIVGFCRLAVDPKP